jgi:hypothetical protein
MERPGITPGLFISIMVIQAGYHCCAGGSFSASARSVAPCG